MTIYLTVTQVAKRLQVTDDTVRNWIQVGRMAAVNIGTDERPQYRILESQVASVCKQVRVY